LYLSTFRADSSYQIPARAANGIWVAGGNWGGILIAKRFSSVFREQGVQAC
jgi:hypothetical protein